MSKSLAKVKSDIRKELLTDFLDKDYAHGYLDEFLNTEIATQIRVLREQQGLSQETLAELAGMKQSRISLLEDVYYDSWSIKTLKKLAEALDVTLKVCFESFTDRIEDVLNLSRESLQRKARELDLATYIDTPHLDTLSEIPVSLIENLEEFLKVSPETLHLDTISEIPVSLIENLEEFLKVSPKTFFEHYIPNETGKIDKTEKFMSLKIERSVADTTLEYKNAA